MFLLNLLAESLQLRKMNPFPSVIPCQNWIKWFVFAQIYISPLLATSVIYEPHGEVALNVFVTFYYIG